MQVDLEMDSDSNGNWITRTSQHHRSQSIDSLEAYQSQQSLFKHHGIDVDFDISIKNESELSEIPEIKIDFEYQINKDPVYKMSDKLFKVTETKPIKFNEDQVKQRTRESLKFWKDEEEKRLSSANQQKTSQQKTEKKVAAYLESIMTTTTKTTTSTTSCTKEETTLTRPTEASVKDKINAFESISIKKEPEIVKIAPKIKNESLKGSKFKTSRSLDLDLDLKTQTIEIPILNKSLNNKIGQSLNSLRSDKNTRMVSSEQSFLSSHDKLDLDADEEEELEIVIDLNHLKNEKNEEKMRQIVMHMIPTTRKAFIDDIVDGVKQLLNTVELDSLKSPVDLPNHIIRFIHRRYSSLLNEDYCLKDVSVSVNTGSSTTSDNFTSLLNDHETTELTVVKEIRKEFVDESESTPDDIIKVNEDTLYIVEKRKLIKDTSPVYNDVDAEIRKSFELKSKLSDDESTIDRKTFVNNETIKKSVIPDTVSNELNTIIDDLRKSVIDKINTDSNQYQVHFFNKHPCLFILYESNNKENFKFSLEKKYHESIMKTFEKNNVQSYTTIGKVLVNLNEVGNDFDRFSIIRSPTSTEDVQQMIQTKMFNSIPIGKYFMSVKYENVKNKLCKESLIDASLLPIPLRTQLIHEYENMLNMFRETRVPPRTPTLYVTPVDFNQVRREIHLNKTALRKNLDPKVTELPQNVEIELNTFYICEKCVNLKNSRPSLVKLSKLDALAVFNLAQAKFKNSTAFANMDSNTFNLQVNKTDTKIDEKMFDLYGNKFYIIDNDTFYRCLIPVYDINVNDEANLKSPQHISSLIVDNNLRRSFVYSRHLMEYAPFNKYSNLYGLLMEVEVKEINLANVKEKPEVEKLSNFSDSVSEQNTASTKSLNDCHVKNKSDKPRLDRKFKLMNNKFGLEGEKFKSAAKTERDRLIIKEIDSMFASIRDHQGSSAKASREKSWKKKAKRSLSWSYTSSKRHVKAKILDLPLVPSPIYVRQSDLKLIKDSNVFKADHGRVFLRIDDYLNHSVSTALQRSYSMNYLIPDLRSRIKYIKFPCKSLGNNEIEMKSYGETSSVGFGSVQSTQYRTAPYDLRYWSILKLLEEEQNGQFITYFDEALTKPEIIHDNSLINHVFGKLKSVFFNFLSKIFKHFLPITKSISWLIGYKLYILSTHRKGYDQYTICLTYF